MIVKINVKGKETDRKIKEIKNSNNLLRKDVNSLLKELKTLRKLKAEKERTFELLRDLESENKE